MFYVTESSSGSAVDVHYLICEPYTSISKMKYIGDAISCYSELYEKEDCFAEFVKLMESGIETQKEMIQYSEENHDFDSVQLSKLEKFIDYLKAQEQELSPRMVIHSLSETVYDSACTCCSYISIEFTVSVDGIDIITVDEGWSESGDWFKVNYLLND